MRNVVTGLMMLAGAVVREKGHGFDDFGWRREVQQAREAQEADAATSGKNGSDRGNRGMTAGASRVVAGPPIGTVGPSRGALMSVAATEDDEVAPGDWDVACEREAGDRSGVRPRLGPRDGRRDAVPLGAHRRRRAEHRRHDLHGGRRLPCEEPSRRAGPASGAKPAPAPAAAIWSTRSATHAAPSRCPSATRIAPGARVPARRTRAPRRRGAGREPFGGSHVADALFFRA